MITRQLSHHVANLQLGTLPDATREAAKRFLLDGIGCLLAGARSEPARAAVRMVAHGRARGGTSTIFSTGALASPWDAAFVNGISLYSVALNDVHKAAGAHPGGCVLPALLALSEAQETSGEDFLAAMVAGYDVLGRLGKAIMPAHRQQGFHPSGTVGPFAAAAAAGRLLKLDPDTLASALGIAGSQAAGLVCFQTDAALTIVFHVGRAARNGVEASLLAREGFTGPRTVLEDPRGGFLSTMTPRYSVEALTHQLGERFEIDETSFRPFYGCTYTIAASSAAQQILRARPGHHAEDVAAVAVRCHPSLQREVDHPDPKSLLAARISMQFNVALVLARGEVVVADVDHQDLADPRIQRLLTLVEFEPDAAMAEWASSVTVRFKDGVVEHAEVAIPKGDPGNPMSWSDVEEKFCRLLDTVGNVQAASAIIEAVGNLETTSTKPLLDALRISGRGV